MGRASGFGHLSGGNSRSHLAQLEDDEMSTAPEISRAALDLVNRLYQAATTQALKYGWATFSFKFVLHIGEWSPASVVIKKLSPVEPTILCIDGAELPLNCEGGRNAAAMLLMLVAWPKDGDVMIDVMESAEADPADGRGDYGLQWLWSGYAGQNMNGRSRQSTTTYRAAVDAESVPAAEKLVQQMEKAGFCLEDRTLDATMREDWTEGQGTTVTYGFQHSMKFVKGNATLVARVQSGWFLTVPEAVDGATAVVTDIWHRGGMVPGGKGQLNKCKRIGRELWQQHGHLVGSDRPQIVVPYETRGGRGGWKVKTARRAFSPSELLDVPKTKQRLPGIRVQLELVASGRDWAKAGERFVRLRMDGKVDMRHLVYEVDVMGEWAILRDSGGPRYRIPVMEWNRLQIKAKQQ